MTGIGGEGGCNRCSDRKTTVVEEGVGALAGERPGDQEEDGLVIDHADSAGDFRVPCLIENVGGGKSRREQGMAHDLIPIEAKSWLDEKAIREQPPILHVTAGLDVGRSRTCAPGEGGIARARRWNQSEAGIWGCRRRLSLLQE